MADTLKRQMNGMSHGVSSDLSSVTMMIKVSQRFSITINFPITGIGKIIKGIKKPPRGRVTKPRQPYDSPEYPPYAPQQQHQTPWGQKSPQRYGNNPNYQNPPHSNPKSYDASADLMKKLMMGQTLTTEELMKLQKSHKP